MEALVAFVVLVGFVALVAGLIVWTQQQYAGLMQIWRGFAQARGMRFVPSGGPWYRRHPTTLEGTFENVPVTIDHFTVSTGKSSTTYTRVTGRAIEPGPGSVHVYHEHVLSSVGKLLGFQDVQVGDAVFDEAFVVKADQDEQARALLDERTRRSLLAFPQHSLSFRYEPEAVRLHWLGIEKDPAVLDAALQVVVAACRWRRPERSFR